MYTIRIHAAQLDAHWVKRQLIATGYLSGFDTLGELDQTRFASAIQGSTEGIASRLVAAWQSGEGAHVVPTLLETARRSIQHLDRHELTVLGRIMARRFFEQSDRALAAAELESFWSQVCLGINKPLATDCQKAAR